MNIFPGSEWRRLISQEYLGARQRERQVFVCPASTVPPDLSHGWGIATYGANQWVMPHHAVIYDFNRLSPPGMNLQQIRRPSEVIMAGDGIQTSDIGLSHPSWPDLRDSRGRGSWLPSHSRTPEIHADEPIQVGEDIDYPHVSSGSANIRYRHNGRAFFVFVDGHVAAIERGQVLNKHIHSYY